MSRSPSSSPDNAASAQNANRAVRRRNRKRNLRVQELEDRQMMALTPPQLVAIIPNEGGLIQPGDPVRHVAPTELTIRFDDATNLAPISSQGITIIRAGLDNMLGTLDDVRVDPGFVGVNSVPNDNELVVRFASPLPDDKYRITIHGGVHSGLSPVISTQGNAFNGGVTVSRDFELDLGALVTAVVPQPFRNAANQALNQARNQIDVYFNNDDLNTASATNRQFYQLIYTNGTADTNDDRVYIPDTVTYDASLDRATITFSQNPDTLAAITDLSQLPTGEGVYRLRLGSTYTPLTVSEVTAQDRGNSYATAQAIGDIANKTVVVSGNIAATALPMQFPGGTDEPGHRDIVEEGHFLPGFFNDTVVGISTMYYNFQQVLGRDLNGFPLYTNVITEVQKDRAREAFEIWGQYLGVKFIETNDYDPPANDPNAFNVTVATADLAALGGLSNVGPSLYLADPTGAASPTGLPMLVIDKADDQQWGSAEFGGDYFETVMSGIGSLLGLGPTHDLPGLTVMGSHLPDTSTGLTGVGGTLFPTPAQVAERIFPGDADIIHGQYLYRPESRDIDVYSVNIGGSGQLKLEVVAERLPDSSLLNAVVSVFDSAGRLIGRNDDYFSDDSFLQLTVGAGTYYIAISSTGNTDFDLNRADSGSGGTTQGNYDLRMNFTQDQSSGMVDSTGTLIDGDLDGVAGGAYNFWFTAATEANTVFVNKKPINPNSAAPVGSRTNPVREIDQALDMATNSNYKVVRIVGNGGNDNNLATQSDNEPYQIGYPSTVTDPAMPDGETMRVPRGVSVMIDGGAIFKLRRANIEVGSFAQGVDFSGGSLQVLGTPTNSVFFTSWNNEALGRDVTSLSTTPHAGDWGGIVFRNELDYDETDEFGNARPVLETEGIFYNYVNHADIAYAGGDVQVVNTPEPFAPIHMQEARPTISFNRITRSAGAAMSADPNSFEESHYFDPIVQSRTQNPYTSGNTGTHTYELRYVRVGPDIDFNTLGGMTAADSNNINGLFIRIDTLAGQFTDELEVAARFDDNIVHVLTETLNIHGSPGGSILWRSDVLDPLTQYSQARQNASLKIDPGTVMKLKNSRIEVQVGASLIAEGDVNHKIIFTSLLDDTYGASGTFNSSASASNVVPVAGDWGGVYFHPVSKGSFDYSVFTYGGGDVPIEGDSARFNVLEIQGGKVRLANSLLANNAAGTNLANNVRNGRGTNGTGTIFIRGAQPVIVKNDFRDNEGDVLSINVNSLNSYYQADWGRSTGGLDDFEQYRVNRGPLIRENRMGTTPSVNLATPAMFGMVVRGGVLDTQSVWDDADMVHVVREEIISQVHHVYSGLDLISSSSSSLVVKFDNGAGLTASGFGLDIDDRIGGSVHVIGQPGLPVVLTSLRDDTVGAGLDLEGNTLLDTNDDNNATSATPGDWRSVRIDKYSNDRNVEIRNENEEVVSSLDRNGIPTRAEDLGQLGRSDKDIDDTLRAGFQVSGYLANSNPGDVDYYSFTARPGTEVWIDLDRTRFALDAVVEVLNAANQLVATSDDSFYESRNPGLLASYATSQSTQLSRVMERDNFSNRDFYSTNDRDPGMRVILPGAVNGDPTKYYVRVKAATKDLTRFANAKTEGQYTLNVRLSSVDEVPGSSVQYADIRYATNGIEVLGMPQRSPLLGETGEGATDNNSTFGNAQNIGNIRQTDMQSLSIGAEIDNIGDIDWYQFTVGGELLASREELIGAIFDVDYASGLGRPDLRVSVFDASGTLILMLNNSNVADDRQNPAVNDSGVTDLARGTTGSLDPFLGVVNLLPGTYYVAISDAAQVPVSLNNPLMRLEPVNSVNRIVEDRIGGTGGTITSATAAIFPNGGAHADDWHLGDVNLWVNTEGDLYTVDGFTGAVETDVTGWDGSLLFLPDWLNSPNVTYNDIAMRRDGQLYTLTQGNLNGNLDQNAISGNYRRLSTADGTILSSVDDEIVTYQLDPTNTDIGNGTHTYVDFNRGVQFEAFTYTSTLASANIYAVGNIDPPPVLTPPADSNFPGFTPTYRSRNLLYILDSTGRVIDDTGDADPDDGRMPTDARPRGELFTGPTMRPVPATDATFPYGTPGDILDGTRLTLRDRDGTLVTFEFDAGPDIAVGPFGAASVRDGNTFTVGDGVNTRTFEFNSGPVLVVNPGTIADGDTVAIADNDPNGSTIITFEWDNDGNTTSGNVAVAFVAADSALTRIGKLTTAINGAAFLASATPSLGPNLGRISISGDNTAPGSIQVTGGSMTLQGDHTFTPGNVNISFEEGDAFNVFGQNVATTVNGTLAPLRTGYAERKGATIADRDRLTFYGAQTIDVSGTPAFTRQNDRVGNPSATGVTPGSVAIPFDAGDDSTDLAGLIASAVNNANVVFPTFGVTAQVNGDTVYFTGASLTTGQPAVTADPPLTTVGQGPGGMITGLAQVNGILYAVDDEGGLYVVNNPTSYQQDNQLDNFLTPADTDTAPDVIDGSAPVVGSGPSLTYVTTSSRDLLGINFTGLTVGPQSTEGGRYANMLFATSEDGRIYAFNTSGQLQAVFNNGATSVATGITGLRGLAFSPVEENPWHVTGRRGADAGHGINASYDLSRGASAGGSSLYFGFENTGTYDAPGGTYGTITSDPFSLKGYAAADQPFMYFNYFLGTGTGDTVQVLFSTDGGAAWQSAGSLTANTGGWLQRRIDLSSLVGEENIKVRFDFTTAADMNVGDITPAGFLRDGGIDSALYTTGTILRGIAGNQLLDGDTFSIQDAQGNLETFEFDMGYSLRLPAGAGNAIADGTTVTITGPGGTRTFEFDKNGSNPANAIRITNMTSAEDVANALRIALAASGIGVTGRVFEDRLHLQAATAVTTTVPSIVIEGDAPGVLDNVGAQPIVVHIGMTASQVAQLIAQGIDQVFSNDRAIVAPAGSAITDGQTFTVSDGTTTRTFEFEDTAVANGIGGGNIAVNYTAGDSATTVATSIMNAINGSNVLVTATQAGSTLNLAGNPSTSNLVFFAPGTSMVTTPTGRIDIAGNFTSVKVDGSLIHVIGLIMFDEGPLPFDRFHPGDSIGNPYTDVAPDNFLNNTRGQSNNFEGLYIDDIIVGFAERGEMVTGVGAGTTFSAPPVVATIGGYNLEIRHGEEYTEDFVPLGFTVIRRQFDTNDRLASGFTVTAPPGWAVQEGEVLRVSDGLRVTVYEFDSDGVRTVPGSVLVTFAADDTDIDVAVALQTAINAEYNAVPRRSGVTANAITTGNKVVLVNAASVDRMATDVNTARLAEEDLRNDDFLHAFNTGLSTAVPGNPGPVTFVGAIGDNSRRNLDGQQGRDVDLYAVTLGLGQRLQVDVDPTAYGFAGDTVLRLFNANGTQVAFSNNTAAPGETVGIDPYLDYTATVAGTYYIGISGAGNTTYNPEDTTTGTNGATANYQMTVQLGNTAGTPREVLAFEGTNDLLLSAVPTGLSSQNRGSFVQTGRIGDHPFISGPNAGFDVDMLAVQLNAGETMRVDVDSDWFHDYVDAELRIFDANGVELAFSEDAAAPGESTRRFDPYINFVAQTTGTYYIGVSGTFNALYDPTQEQSGFFPGEIGVYKIEVAVGINTGLTHTEYEDQGDQNTSRKQGYTILRGNTVSHSSQYGIVVDQATRDAAGNQPHTSPVHLLSQQNLNQLTYGVSIVNNVIAFNGLGGIHMGGDANTTATEPSGASLFARIINNTIYGDTTATGVGVLIDDHAAPTLINNVFANLVTGVQTTANAGQTVLQANAFASNTADFGGNLNNRGSFALSGLVSSNLFVDAPNGVFYPKAGAAIIDSSLNSLNDRPEITTVTAPLGIFPSPILAPERDFYGALRTNDIDVTDAPGLGSQIFKDRGAIDRIDTTQPSVTLANPVDNDANGFDNDPDIDDVQYVGGPDLTNFSLQFVDGVVPFDPAAGTGINDATVTTGAFVITRGGTTLVEGTDYRFTYNAVTNTVVIEPLPGIWLPGAYQITVANTITDLAGNTLKPNRNVGANGITQFNITIPLPFDFGDAPDSYGTTLANNGASNRVRDDFHLGSLNDIEFDGVPSVGANGDDLSTSDDEDGVAFIGTAVGGGDAVIPEPATLFPGTNARFQVTASAPGKLDVWIDLDGNGTFTGAGEHIVTNASLNTGTNMITVMIPATAAQQNTSYMRFWFSETGQANPTGTSSQYGEVEDYQISIGGTSPWQNPDGNAPGKGILWADVNDTGGVTVTDLSIVSLWLSQNPLNLPHVTPTRIGPLPTPTVGSPPPYVDVNGDNYVDLTDLALIRQAILAGGVPEGPDAQGEGEDPFFSSLMSSLNGDDASIDAVVSGGSSSSSPAQPFIVEWGQEVGKANEDDVDFMEQWFPNG